MRRKVSLALLLLIPFLLISLLFLRKEITLAQESLDNQAGSLSHQKGEVKEEVIRKAFDLSGQIKINHSFFGEDEKAGLYQLKNSQQQEKSTSADVLQTQLQGKHKVLGSHFFWRLDSYAHKDNLGLTRENKLNEAYATWSLGSELQVVLGKKRVAWGRSHSWNSLAFLDTPRYPLDTEQPHEGVISLGAEYKRKYPVSPDPLQAISISPVLFPVQEKVNENLGQPNHWNLGGKLSLLFWNTEIDFLALKGESRPERYGFSFSRHLGTSLSQQPNTPLEIHGDFWVIPQHEKTFVDRSGQLWKTTYAVFCSLWGLQYEKEDICFVLEYYRNKAGFTLEEMNDYYQYLHTTTAADQQNGEDRERERDRERDQEQGQEQGQDQGQDHAKRIAVFTEKYYTRPDLMQEYLYAYLRPLQILHLTTSISGIWNIQDQSFALCSELQYQARPDLRVGLRGTFWEGAPYTEFGEKVNDWAVDVSITYSFDFTFYYSSNSSNAPRYIETPKEFSRDALPQPNRPTLDKPIPDNLEESNQDAIEEPNRHNLEEPNLDALEEPIHDNLERTIPSQFNDAESTTLR